MLKGALLGLANRRSVYQLITRYGLLSDIAWRYVAGERLQDGVAVARALNGRGLHVSLDHLGESVSSEAEAAEATSAYLDALKAIGTEHLAANISLKLTQLGLDLSPDLARDNLRRRGLGIGGHLLEHGRRVVAAGNAHQHLRGHGNLGAAIW